MGQITDNNSQIQGEASGGTSTGKKKVKTRTTMHMDRSLGFNGILEAGETKLIWYI